MYHAESIESQIADIGACIGFVSQLAVSPFVSYRRDHAVFRRAQVLSGPAGCWLGEAACVLGPWSAQAPERVVELRMEFITFPEASIYFDDRETDSMPDFEIPAPRL